MAFTYHKSILIATALMLPVMVFGQRLEKPQIDKINGDTTFNTSQKRIASTADILGVGGNVLGADVTKVNGVYYLNLEVDALGDNGYFSVSKGASLVLKLKDNTLLQLPGISDEQAVYDSVKLVSSSRSYWTADLSYLVSPDDIEKILSSEITVIRVEADKQNFDFDIKPKSSNVLKKMFKLILGAG